MRPLLSPRQTNVLQLLAKDYSPAATAEALGISLRSVYTACDLAKDKMGLNHTNAVVAEAMRRGLVK